MTVNFTFSYRGAFAWNDLPNNVVNGYMYNRLIRSFKTFINNHFNALHTYIHNLLDAPREAFQL